MVGITAYIQAWFSPPGSDFVYWLLLLQSPVHSSADDMSRDSSLPAPEDLRPKIEPVIENTHPAHSSTPVTNGINKKRWAAFTGWETICTKLSAPTCYSAQN